MVNQEKDDDFADDELEQLNREVARMMEAHNTAPDVEMGGLSPNQVDALMARPLGEADAAIQLAVDLPLARLQGSRFYQHARALLRAVEERDGVKATATGSLPRKFVGEMLDSSDVDEKLVEQIRAVNKVINETDFFPLHIARVVCQQAGLLTLRKRRFSVPAKKKRLLTDEAACALFRELFIAFCRKFNWDYSSGWNQDLPAVQRGASFSFYQLAREAREERSVTELYDVILLPVVRHEVEMTVAGFQWLTPSQAIARHLLERLIDWGLLEGWYQKERYTQNLTSVKITPLYRDFFRFSL